MDRAIEALITAAVEKRWTDGMEWKAEERKKLERYSINRAINRMKLARKAERDGRLEEAIEWYGGAVWFLNRYWPHRARVRLEKRLWIGWIGCRLGSDEF